MKQTRGHILVVDDEKDIRQLFQDILTDEGYQVTTAANGVQAQAAWHKSLPDVIFLDVWMPDIDGITLLKQMKEEGLLAHTNVVMISGHGTIETAVEATRLGAWDFLEKPLSLNRLLVATERAIKHLRLVRHQHQLRSQLNWDSELIGKSKYMRQLRADAQRLAQYKMPVLITGERGSGRHQFARAVHRLSPRGERPLMVVDAQQLNNDPNRWLGCETEAGIQVGELEHLQGGSLLINDIHLLHPQNQQVILDLIQTAHFTRPGAQQPTQLDVRIFALSNQTLSPLAEAGHFLPQLAQRLELTHIQLPPLRTRPDDLPELVDYFTDRLSQQQGLPWRPFDIAAQNVLRQHHWPGNLLELQNIIQRLLLQGEGAVTAEEVRSLLQQHSADDPDQCRPNTQLPLKAARETFEARYLKALLKETGGNVSEAAQRAGLERTHLYRKLKQLNIDPKAL